MQLRGLPCRRIQFLYQFTNALVSIPDRFNRSRLSVLLGNGDRNRLCVDIQTNKLYALHRPAAFACGSAFWFYRLIA
jgi:hypothetical protein